MVLSFLRWQFLEKCIVTQGGGGANKRVLVLFLSLFQTQRDVHTEREGRRIVQERKTREILLELASSLEAATTVSFWVVSFAKDTCARVLCFHSSQWNEVLSSSSSSSSSCASSLSIRSRTMFSMDRELCRHEELLHVSSMC